MNLWAPYKLMRWPYLVLKSLKSAFKASKNEEKDIEMPYDITRDELAHMAKRIKKFMKFNKRFYKNQEYRKGKKPTKQTHEKFSNDKWKGSSKGFSQYEPYKCPFKGYGFHVLSFSSYSLEREL